MRISLATPKKATGGAAAAVGPLSLGGDAASLLAAAFLGAPTGSALAAAAAGGVSDVDPSNTTLFVGGLDASVPEERLRQVFGQYGDITYVKVSVLINK